MFRKTLSAALFVVTFAAATAIASQQPAQWEKFNSVEGRFQILVPSKPELEVKDVDSPVGKLTLYAYSASNNTGYYLVSYGDYPVEPPDAAQKEKVLDGVRVGVLNGLGAELNGEEKKIAHAGHPGREFTAGKSIQGTDVVFTWRIYLVGRRLYQLAVVTPKADAGSPDVMKFLASFEVNK